MNENEHYDALAEQARPLTSVLDLEDFPIFEVDPVECATRDLEAWRQDDKQPRPADIYRKWAHRLRELQTDEALSILRAVQLECTVPYNELETPHWLDSYTGEIISDDNCHECNQPVPLGEKRCPKCGIEVISDTPIQLPDWQHFLVTRFPQAYNDEETAALAMKASSEWVGVEEEYLITEDRGYEPETFSESVFTTDELDFLRLEIEPINAALRKRISIEAERGGKSEQIKMRVRKSVEATNLMIVCQSLIDSGNAPQDVFMLLRPFTHAYGFDETDWAIIELHERVLMQHENGKLYQPFSNLYEWALDFEDMINVTEEATPMAHTFTSEDEVRDIAEQFLRELIDVIPVEGDRSPFNLDLNPILRSRYYVEGFLRAQINSSPTPSLEAWSYWRQKTSPAGSLAYETGFKSHGNRKRAMSAFWKAAIQAGDVAPTPKRIAAVKPSGLLLSTGKETTRKITWSTACKIASSEGFHNPERLIEILQAKKWGLQLVSVLESNMKS